MKLREFLDEMYAAAENGMECLMICVYFPDTGTTEQISFSKERQRVVNELKRLFDKGGHVLALIGAQPTEMDGIWELRPYYKTAGEPWKECKDALLITIGARDKLSRMAGIAPEDFADSDVVVVAGSKPQMCQ